VKRHSFVLLIFFMLMPVAIGFAQTQVSVIDSLDIEIWPDYDRASVLVLLTGTLPKDTRLPASVTIPLPEGAQLNAVARIDSKDGSMVDDIFTSNDAPDTLTFVTPDPRFRVEYYLPYTASNNQRSFDYTWLAAVSINNLQLRVQRPLSAGTLVTEPAAENITRNGDGFDYHSFPPRAVPAGQSVTLHVDYKMNTAQLSATQLTRSNAGLQNAEVAAAPGTNSGFKWALVAIIAGGLLIFGALIWQVASRRHAANIQKSGGSQVKKNSQAKFCRNCGAAIDNGDKFCTGCGSEL
jgi:hypothetical protein